MFKVVILTGIPASGKSTFYKEMFFPQYMYVSLDQVRTRSAEAELFSFCLRRKKNCVIDNTNVNAAERSRYIGKAKASGARVCCYYFEPDIDASDARNANRSGRANVPAGAIRARAAAYGQPRFDEGFDEISRVSITQDGKFKVEVCDAEE